MSYADKVQATVSSVHETAIANKIIDMMQELKLKNDEKTACRWMPIKYEGDEIFVEEYPEKILKLFCLFPFIEAEDFSFPVVVNMYPNSRIKIGYQRIGLLI